MGGCARCARELGALAEQGSPRPGRPWGGSRRPPPSCTARRNEPAPNGRHPAAVVHISGAAASSPQGGATARRPRTPPPAAYRSRGPPAVRAQGPWSGRRGAGRGRASPAAARPRREARGQAAARERAVEPNRAQRTSGRGREAAVVVNRVRPLPAHHREDDQRPRLAAAHRAAGTATASGQTASPPARTRTTYSPAHLAPAGGCGSGPPRARRAASASGRPAVTARSRSCGPRGPDLQVRRTRRR